MDRNARVRWWFVQALTVLGLAAVFAVFFMAWVPARRTYLTQRSFRQLADMGDQIQETLANLHVSLTNAASDAQRHAAELGQTNRLQFHGLLAWDAIWNPFAGPIGAASNATNVALWLDPAVASAQGSFAAAARMIEPRVEMVRGITRAALLDLPASFAPRVTVSRGLKNYWLNLAYESSSGTNAAFEIRSDFSTLLQPIVTRYDFDDLILVNADGDVIFQSTEAGLRITNLSAAAELRITRVPDFAAPGARREAGLLGTNVSGGVTTLAAAELADGSCKVFVQPLKFSLVPGESATGAVQWHVVGLVRAREFNARAMALPATAVILFFFAALGALLAWPFLNLAFAGDGDPPGRGVAAAAGVAGFLACAGLTFLVLDTGTYPRMKADLDGQLEELADRLTANLHGELQAVHAQLQDFNQHLSAEAGRAVQEMQETNRLAPTNSLRVRARLSTNELGSYPWLRMAVWCDAQGQQVAKWTPFERNTPFVTVKDRNYFRSHAEGRAWPVQCPADSKFPLREGFYLEPLFSRTRGENVAELSVRFTNAWPAETEATGDVSTASRAPVVAYLEFRPLSLIEAIVPPGYGFCVVEGSGQVLFHSDERRNLRENFLKESDRKPRLLGALQGRTADHFDLRYLNRLNHVRVSPLQCLPWSLIVFRDQHVLGSSRQAMLSAAGVLFCLYTGWLILLLVFRALLSSAWRALANRSAPASLIWLWPDRNRTRQYLSLLCWLVLVGGALLALLWSTSDPVWIIGAGLALPLIAAAPVLVSSAAGHLGRRGKSDAGHHAGDWLARLALLMATRSEPPSSTHEPGTAVVPAGALPRVRLNAYRFLRREAYPCCLGLAFVVLAMLPALGCFRISGRMETAAFLRSSQMDLGQDLRQRHTRVQRAMSSLPEPTRTQLMPRRLAETFDRCDSAFLGTRVQSGSSDLPVPLQEPAWFLDLYRVIRLRVDENGIRTGGLLPSQASDHSWRSHFERGELITELAGSDPATGRGPLRVSTPMPRFRWPDLASVHGSWYLLLLLAATTPFALAHFIARRIFLWRVWSPRPRHEAEALVPVASRAGVAAATPPPAVAEATRSFVEQERLHVRVIDLARPMDQAWLVPGRTRKLERGGVVALAHWDRSLPPASGVHKALFRAELEREPARVVVLLQDVPARPDSPAAATGSDMDRAKDAALQICRRHELLWEECLPREKWLLDHVAHTGLAEADAPELKTLLGRGLLCLDPRLRLCSESFRRFVLNRFPADQVARRQPESEAGAVAAGWQMWKGALGVALTAGAMFLFMTQREVWQLAVGLATSFATGFTQISRIAGMFRREKKSDEGK